MTIFENVVRALLVLVECAIWLVVMLAVVVGLAWLMLSALMVAP